MNADAVKIWVKRQKTWGSVQNALISLLALAAGIVVVFLTFWLAYAVIWFGWTGVSAASQLLLGRKLHLTHDVRLVCSGVFLVLLFIQYFRTDPLHWGDYPKGEYRAAPASSALGGMAVMLAHPGASANLVADILLGGPKLLAGSWSLFAKANRLRRLDENGCAELLMFLCSQAKVVPYEELSSAGWAPWFGQIRCLDGVLPIQKGFLISEELRQELVELKSN